MEIEFGNLEQSQPQLNVRPDQDAHFLVATIGEPAPDELKMFVDLDCLRDMEAHAHTNTRVELGGVMLGQQCIDDLGQPFVLITDSLRAEHYQATQGSFKFTHDTWSKITRQRKTFRPDLEMVGWYHTHPGWSVFLSGMDLFICNNFFNRPLDVALVIDPCADDRGWFQWLPSSRSGGQPATGRTGGFYLTTVRYRQKELDYFARLYNQEPAMNQDPRYANHVSEISYLGSRSNLPGENLMDHRKPVFEIAILSIIVIQFLLFALIGWKILTPPINSPVAAEGLSTARQHELNELAAVQVQRIRDQAYQEILASIVGAQTGETDLVKDYAELKTANHQLQSNVAAQIALAEKLNREQAGAEQALLEKTETVDKLSGQLVVAREDLKIANQELESLAAEVKEPLGGEKSQRAAVGPGTVQMKWWWLMVGGIVTAAIAGLVGYFLRTNRSSTMFYDDRNDGRRTDQNDDENEGASFGTLADRSTATTVSSKTLT